ncbi:MAG: Luciferase family oxidoreductase, group 1 [Candidatus Tokpelaia hoelldobleri]|uniref:Luciferase-like monooxygenase n=1 Tax=Candidatus Tokpelaia hoelldobleri TaxID=1902579 RepID=A0A1U9JUK2_9HYPH|nr:MAG: Luciferase family oxidoreductase, group 1 [Candidatus Tokpelaia hoelldoblerii]
MKISVLDLCMVSAGSTVTDTLENTIELAKELEKLGFPRIWYAEHHNMTGIASAATSVIMGQVAAATSTIRVGSGGVMLPNHAPLVIAEQFGTLEALYPGRIELGVGRAPGTDQMTAHALRRHLTGSVDDFPRDVVELLNYFKPVEESQRLRAVPGAGLGVPVWILGSSLFGAQLAAILGLPYAFASHFAPAELDQALHVYRERFQPSEYLDKPRAMVAFNAIVAPTDEEANYLFSSLQQSFINLRTGEPGLFPAPAEGYADNLPPQYKMVLEQTLSCSAVGSPDTVKQQIRALLERTKADELIAAAPIHNPEKRLQSFRFLADIMADL